MREAAMIAEDGGISIAPAGRLGGRDGAGGQRLRVQAATRNIYAQREIDRSDRQLTGRGFATAAVVIGLIEVW